MPNEQELTMQDVQLLIGAKELNMLLLQREIERLRKELAETQAKIGVGSDKKPLVEKS